MDLTYLVCLALTAGEVAIAVYLRYQLKRIAKKHNDLVDCFVTQQTALQALSHLASSLVSTTRFDNVISQVDTHLTSHHQALLNQHDWNMKATSIISSLDPDSPPLSPWRSLN
jgi:hypothetical protein